MTMQARQFSDRDQTQVSVHYRGGAPCGCPFKWVAAVLHTQLYWSTGTTSKAQTTTCPCLHRLVYPGILSLFWLALRLVTLLPSSLQLQHSYWIPHLFVETPTLPHPHQGQRDVPCHTYTYPRTGKVCHMTRAASGTCQPTWIWSPCICMCPQYWSWSGQGFISAPLPLLRA